MTSPITNKTTPEENMKYLYASTSIWWFQKVSLAMSILPKKKKKLPANLNFSFRSDSMKEIKICFEIFWEFSQCLCYVMYHIPFPWMPLIFHYLWFLPSMMEPIKIRHHLNITIPNGSWSICSTIRCIFLAVVLQALLVMRSDEVEGGLPISSTSRSGALARLFKYSW